jgi:hypothetical protein
VFIRLYPCPIGVDAFERSNIEGQWNTDYTDYTDKYGFRGNSKTREDLA